MSAVVVVEGESDRVAVEALAARRGVELGDVVALGGAHRIGTFLGELDASHVVGLCDAGEAHVFRRAFERSGVAQAAFYVCDADLEDELIRALGVAAVEEVLRAGGDLNRFRKLQHMPQWRGCAPDEQLRRFLASGARRKIRYAQLLVDALDLEHVPQPLDALLREAAA